MRRTDLLVSRRETNEDENPSTFSHQQTANSEHLTMDGNWECNGNGRSRSGLIRSPVAAGSHVEGLLSQPSLLQNILE